MQQHAERAGANASPTSPTTRRGSRRCIACCSAARRRRTKSKAGRDVPAGRGAEAVRGAQGAKRRPTPTMTEGEGGRRRAARRPTRPTTPTPQADGMMAGVVARREDRRRREEEDAAGDDVRPLREGAAELERVPVRELTCHIDRRPPVTRREALCRIGSGFGMMAFAGLVGESLVGGRPARSSRRRRPTSADCIIRRAPSTSSSCS